MPVAVEPREASKYRRQDRSPISTRLVDDPEVKRVARGEVPDLETALREVHLAGYTCREVLACLRRLARP
jgi:hypothetical protein